MRIKRIIAIFSALMAVGLSSLFLMPSHYLASLINTALPVGWKLVLPERLSADLNGILLPQFQLNVEECPLISVQHLRLDWHKPHSLSLAQAVLDYACFAKIPTSAENSADPLLSHLLVLAPEGKASIKALTVVHLPETLSPRFLPLLAGANNIELTYLDRTFSVNVKQSLGELNATLSNGHLVGNVVYFPQENEDHQLQFEANLADNLTALPSNLKANYTWQLPNDLVNVALQKGSADLTWQQTTADQFAGVLQLSLKENPENQLYLPFEWQGNRFSIQQGKIDWVDIDAFPLHAYLTAEFEPYRLDWADLFPIQTKFKLSVLSQNAKGKGNVVISTQNGEIQKNAIQLPLQINGNVKHQAFILYSSIPLDISGHYDDVKLRFLQGALFRITGKARFLRINDLRFPLAGIQVDKYGIHGRLQAIFRGESPDFKQIDMRLDGTARNFKAGALDFFEDAVGKNSVKDQWLWRFWGETTLNQLKSKVNVAGRGNWHHNLVELSEFQGLLSEVKQGGVRIPKTELELTQPITFAYENFQLVGGVSLFSPQIEFSYGGELEKPKLDVLFNGEVENLNFKGEFTSGALGPIRLFARRELQEKASQFRGKLYWPEQSAMVFQSLFPFRQNWVITEGTIKGETAFSVTDKQGIIAGGHFSIKNGHISLPEGEIKGLQFSLPYQYKRNEVDIGAKKPLELTAREVDIGVKLENIRVKIAGHLPYRNQKPLFLRELSLELLGGRLTVDRFALPQTKEAYLKLQGIRFENILALAQYHQLKLTGSANGTFPFWLSGKPCYICKGKLIQAENSFLRLTPELLKAIRQGGYTEQILSYMVNDSQVNNLNAVIDVDSEGQMFLKATVQSHLSAHQNAKINLNYTHQENLFDLWKLINYGSQFEQQIEHSIYQQLDQKQ